MKNIFLILTLMIGMAAAAADFRGLSFGDQCHRIRESEERAGSTLLHAEENYYVFRSSYDGLPAKVAYWCAEGKFREGVYLFDYTSYEEAVALYKVLKQQLVAGHGSPTHDAASPEYHRKVEELTGRKVRDADIYSSLWEKELTEIQLGIYGPAGGQGWSVSVSFEAKKRI